MASSTTPSPQTTSPTKRAFSLIELLVVLVLIAVLIALLLPALASARAAVQNMDCRHRMRQIGVATAMYAADFAGFMVPGVTNDGIRINWPNVHSFSGPTAYYERYLPLNNRWDGPFMCQTYRTDGINPRVQQPGSSTIRVSYTYKILVGYTYDSPPLHLPLIKINDVHNPSARAYLIDGIYRNSDKVWYGLFAWDVGTHSHFPMDRHPGKTNNLLYFDGHSDGMTGTAFVQNKSQIWREGIR